MTLPTAWPPGDSPFEPSARRRGKETVPEPPIVLVTLSQQLQDDVARIAAAAGVELQVVSALREGLALQPEVLLLGTDCTAVPVPAGRRNAGTGTLDVIVVGPEEGYDAWRLAERMDAARVAVLPAAAGWLAEYLSRRRQSGSGLVVGVLAGSGGAGATTLACWLAHAAVRNGVSALLVDGDPWGGSLELALGALDVHGVRWPDLADVRGTLNPLQLISNLPQVEGFSLLSMRLPVREQPGEEQPGGGAPSYPGARPVAAVVSAARAGYQLTVVDLARHAAGLDLLLPSCDALLVIVPGQIRQLLAARAMLADVGTLPALGVIRGPVDDGLDEQQASDILGVPLAGYLPRLRGMGPGTVRGDLLLRGRRLRARRAVGAILHSVLPRQGQAGQP